MREDQKNSNIHFSILLFFLFYILSSCSLQKQISASAKVLINDTSLRTAHTGISIYEPATGKYWFNYQGDKYFVPASNTKIPTCYAAMKYLGDSLDGSLVAENDTAMFFLPAGDPTLLHPDYIKQPVIELLQQTKKKIFITDVHETRWKIEPLGLGWSWNDYNESYMAERNALPIYGNLIRWVQEKNDNNTPVIIYSVPEVNWTVNFNTDTSAKTFNVKRNINDNIYELTQGRERHAEQYVPFATNGIKSALELLADTIHKYFITLPDNEFMKSFFRNDIVVRVIKSQPTDSLLRPMMHRSDNFFAEQTLLMVCYKKFGVMNDEKIIDTVLKTDFRDLPQKPRWVDGSGLSRYNLFSPQDFVAILNKMKNEFGMKRIENILPTGGTGTLSNYYKADSGHIFAKTGSLSGVIALSGYLYTKKKKLLIFSILVNNHQVSATTVRRTVEKFIQGIRNEY